ncbi:hypothetical protein GCM10020358_00820 [Amorphoplanes nipponensis]|uniref:Uncharacterized protein n=1 Tax=Actinoplanes nipponensis TaxID=135950 RepID=A0A919JCZ5_9ACTN|nr:hypothetical protein [Actinoplanes nipponensis]GIE47312.1 hypothetical protein Ani05nite_08460 [Actinoplanes nipponensis]
MNGAGPGHPRLRWLAVAADLLALASAVLGVLAWLRNRGGFALLLVTGGAALLLGSIALVAGAPARRRFAAALAVLAVVAGGGVAGVAVDRLVRPRDAAVDPATLRFRFDPVLETVPFCRDYPGTGRIPDGYQLLMFDRPTADPAADLWLDGPAERTDRGWVFRNVQLGDEPTPADPDRNRGLQVELFARLVAAETAEVLTPRSNITVVNDPGGQWKVRALPGRRADTLRVTLNADRGACAPG